MESPCSSALESPPNSVDLEQREGHAHRYHGRAVLKNIARKVSVNGNGHHSNGGDALGIGPTVELVPVNGHANGNGHGNGTNGHRDDEATEPQQSLFSWAEFMAEEPVKPKGRTSKPQPATLSMFEWALTVEQEREKEPAGAGR